MLAHQLAIGALNGRWLIGGLHAQHVTGIFQGRPALCLLPATTARLLLLIAVAKLRAALHHAQELIKLRAGDPQLFSNHIQHRTFVRVKRAVGERRLDLDLQKHPN